MSEPDSIQSLIQIGFAASVAAWLVRWLTLEHQKRLDANTTVLVNLQLQLAEMYRVLLLMDLNLRQVDLTPGDNTDELHREAICAFEKTLARLDAIRAALEKSLERLK